MRVWRVSAASLALFVHCSLHLLGLADDSSQRAKEGYKLLLERRQSSDCLYVLDEDENDPVRSLQPPLPPTRAVAGEAISRNDTTTSVKSIIEDHDSCRPNESSDSLAGANGGEEDNETSSSILKLSHHQAAFKTSANSSSTPNDQQLRAGAPHAATSSKRDPTQNSSNNNSNKATAARTPASKGRSKLKLFSNNFTHSQIGGQGGKKTRSLGSLLTKSRRNQLEHSSATQAPQAQMSTETPETMGDKLSSSSFDASFDPFLTAAGSLHRGVLFPDAYSPIAALAAASQNFMHLAAANNLIGHQPRFQQQQPQQAASRQPSIAQTAVQSIEHSQRAANNDLPIYFATTSSDSPTAGGLRNHQEDKTGAGITLVQAPTLAANHHQHQSAAAAAAAMIGERSKNLFGHIGGGGSSIHQSSPGHALGGGLVGGNFGGHSLKAAGSNAPGNGGGFMKGETAESWGAPAGAGPAAGTTPAIIVEHDGPSITTVDFDNNFRGRLSENNNNDDDEDENSFYAAEEDEESLGSHEASRVAPKQLRQQKLQQQSQHARKPTPFEHQPQSNALFYNQNQNILHGQRRNIGHSMLGQEVADDAVRDYMRLQRVIDQQRQPQRHHRQQQQRSQLSQQDQQDFPDSINAIKEQEEGGGEKSGGPSLASAIRTRLVNSSDDQIEQLIKELQDLNDSKRNGSNNNNGESGKRPGGRVRDEYDDYDEDDDEETRALRKKLLSRLRHKQHRKRGLGSSSMSASASIMQDPAVKIPLHALLMAALDRRMSPSELISRSASFDTGSTDRTANVTALTTTTTANDYRPTTSGELIPVGVHQFLDADFDERLVAGRGERHHDYGDRTNLSFVPASSEPNNLSVDIVRPSGTFEAQQPVPAATTPMPVMIANRPQASNNNYYSNSNNNSSSSSSSSGSKARREAPQSELNTSEGDFDIDKQVEEFARDRDESAQLEPAWIRQTGGGGGRRNERLSKPIESEDDDENLNSSDSNSNRPAGKGKRLRGGGGKGSYDASENKFFNRLQRDTREEDDIDKNTSGIEDPISAASDRLRRSRNKQVSPSDSDGGDSDPDDREDFRQIESEDDDRDEGARRTTWRPQMVDDEVSKIEELAMLKAAEQEREEKRRKSHKNIATREYYPENDNEEPDIDNNSNQRFEESSESKIHETTAQPATTTAIMTAASSGETGDGASAAEINQQQQQSIQTFESQPISYQNYQTSSTTTMATPDSAISKDD